MATYTADIILTTYEVLSLEPIPATTPLSLRKQYYKLRATSDLSPSGYITWVNTTGDDQGKPTPGGTIGPTIVVSRWVQ